MLQFAPPKIKPMKKLSNLKLGLLFVPTALAIATPAPARAFDLSQVFGQVQQYVTGYLEKLAKPQLDALSKGLGQDVTGLVTDTTGALGLPDPFASRDRVQEQVGSSGTTYYGETATNAVDSQITRASAASVLSEAGQTQMQQESQNTQTAVNGVEQNAQTADRQANTASSATSTQDVVKQMALQNSQLARQQAQNSALVGSINANMQRQIEAQNLSNINLANISTTVTGVNQGQNFAAISQGQENFRRGASASLF